MTVKELRDLLASYPDDYTIRTFDTEYCNSYNTCNDTRLTEPTIDYVESSVNHTKSVVLYSHSMMR